LFGGVVVVEGEGEAAGGVVLPAGVHGVCVVAGAELLVVVVLCVVFCGGVLDGIPALGVRVLGGVAVELDGVAVFAEGMVLSTGQGEEAGAFVLGVVGVTVFPGVAAAPVVPSLPVVPGVGFCRGVPIAVPICPGCVVCAGFAGVATGDEAAVPVVPELGRAALVWANAPLTVKTKTDSKANFAVMIVSCKANANIRVRYQ
jgi:hypothetical protein